MEMSEGNRNLRLPVWQVEVSADGAHLDPYEIGLPDRAAAKVHVYETGLFRGAYDMWDRIEHSVDVCARTETVAVACDDPQTTIKAWRWLSDAETDQASLADA